MASVGTLAAGIAHEVGNPLTAIIGYADVALRRVEAGQGDPELLESIRSEAQRIDGIVRGLLDFARPQPDEIAPVKVDEVVEGGDDHGVVVVATSNRPPQDLYKDGLQRETFIPFIGMIENRLDIMELDAGIDYRLDRLQQMDVYLTPADSDAEARLNEDFESLSIGAPARPVTLSVQGRDIEIPKVAEGVAMAGFEELCAQPLGPGDYLEIARCFHTLIVKGIPILGSEKRNEAKRFVTLIDALYEARVNLICSAEAPADALYTEGDGAFEFERTVSRLMEMRSAEYIALAHIG